MRNVLRVAGGCVNPEQKFYATVVINIETGLITAIEGYDKNADIVARDLIFPGFLDVHVHGREDITREENYKEDFETLGKAAVNGGVVHVAEMGNNPKPPVDLTGYLAKEELTSTCVVPVTLYAMMGPETHPLQGEHVPYKLCHARTTGKSDTIFFPTQAAILETAERYVGRHVSQHCEDLEVLELHKGEKLHENKRPPQAEENSIDLGLWLIEHIFGQGKLCHCSVATGIDKIVHAKRRGVQVTCEITPHHLYFDSSMITDENRPWMQMNPPLRSKKDRLFCIGALKRGDIDVIATDHAPHTPDDKMNGASGQPHLDTLGPFITWLMKEHDFSPSDIARVCSTAPAAFLNKFLRYPESGHGYGRIAPGYIGSLTLIDRTTPITIAKETLKTKCGWSPFEGVTFPGSVQHTIVRGKVLK